MIELAQSSFSNSNASHVIACLLILPRTMLTQVSLIAGYSVDDFLIFFYKTITKVLLKKENKYKAGKVKEKKKLKEKV